MDRPCELNDCVIDVLKVSLKTSPSAGEESFGNCREVSVKQLVV